MVTKRTPTTTVPMTIRGWRIRADLGQSRVEIWPLVPARIPSQTETPDPPDRVDEHDGPRVAAGFRSGRCVVTGVSAKPEAARMVEHDGETDVCRGTSRLGKDHVRPRVRSAESRKVLGGHDGVCVDRNLEEVRSGSGTHVLTLNTTTVDRPSLIILAGRCVWNPVFERTFACRQIGLRRRDPCK